MTRPGGLLPRTPEDGAKDDDDDTSSLRDDAASHESGTSRSSEQSILGKRRARRKAIRRNFALGLVGYGAVVMVVCLSINIVVGRGTEH